MVRGVTRPADERMSPQAKVVFGIVILLSLAILVVAYFGTRTSGDAKAALNRQDCRSLFTAPITDANADSSAADNEVRRAQFLGQYYGLVTEDKKEFNQSVELGFKGLKEQHEAGFRLKWYNEQYQVLIRAQKNDHSRFREMCSQGPKNPPPAPPYSEPPR